MNTTKTAETDTIQLTGCELAVLSKGKKIITYSEPSTRKEAMDIALGLAEALPNAAVIVWSKDQGYKQFLQSIGLARHKKQIEEKSLQARNEWYRLQSVLLDDEERCHDESYD